MRTLYIDHSIVTHEASREGLRRAIESGKIRLVLSVWNMYEICAASDLAQRQRRIAFLSGLSPLYVVERRAIQRQEVERFLWPHKFGVAPRDMVAITSSLSVVDSFFAGPQTRIGLTISQFVRETDFAALSPSRRLSPEALRTLQSAGRTTLKKKEGEIFEAWIVESIPDVGPNGVAFTVSEKGALLTFCWQRKSQFFGECRCLAVEDALFSQRTNNAQRNPTESDGPDLQHTAVALAYCDVFYSRDRYQIQCAVAAQNSLRTLELSVVCDSSVGLGKTIAAF
jgi:hypothetical protein